ncbi:hypothetical protein LTR56_024284 [Elasticomyces elasticus]|nr:hypothetical protein LTR56_024284 [Elasticomyces elasticus]KAK4905899.1 hypothetical protein LTR49_024869 [Elasticomyces elasticus]
MAGSSKGLSRKEQNRINQKNFRARKRAREEEAARRTQADRHRQVELQAELESCRAENEVLKTGAMSQRLSTPASLSAFDHDQNLDKPWSPIREAPGEPSPSTWLDDYMDARPHVGSQHYSTPSRRGSSCSSTSADPSSLATSRSTKKADFRESVDAIQPTGRSGDFSCLTASQYMPRQTEQNIFPGLHDTPEYWPSNGILNTDRILPSIEFPPTVAEWQPPTESPYPNDFMLHLGQSQQLALKSAEWYARAAEASFRIVDTHALYAGPVVNAWRPCTPQPCSRTMPYSTPSASWLLQDSSLPGNTATADGGRLWDSSMLDQPLQPAYTDLWLDAPASRADYNLCSPSIFSLMSAYTFSMLPFFGVRDTAYTHWLLRRVKG